VTKIAVQSRLMTAFGLNEPTPTYGRLAFIHCDEKQAIELLEVVAPEGPV
jgi:hypothetical protein